MIATRPTLVPNRLLGVDLSSHQHPNGAKINYRDLAEGGVVWAYIKEGEDRRIQDDDDGEPYDYYTNPYFEEDFNGCREVGIVTGIYRYVRPTGTSPAESITRSEDNIRRVVGDTGLPRFSFYVCDFEDPYGGDQLQWLSEFDNGVRDSQFLCQGNGQAVWNYSGLTFLQRHGCLVVGSTPTQYNYIHAAYQKNKPPTPPGYTMSAWQFYDKAFVPGIDAICDINVFFGAMDDLLARTMP